MLTGVLFHFLVSPATISHTWYMLLHIFHSCQISHGSVSSLRSKRTLQRKVSRLSLWKPLSSLPLCNLTVISEKGFFLHSNEAQFHCCSDPYHRPWKNDALPFPFSFQHILSEIIPSSMKHKQSLGIQLSIKQPPTVWGMRYVHCTKEKSHWEKKTFQNHLNSNTKCDCTLFEVGHNSACFWYLCSIPCALMQACWPLQDGVVSVFSQ